MKMFRKSKYLVAIASLVLVFAGCKGESPTAPSPATPGGTVTPPASATIAISVSNASPLVDSTSVITATVTQNGSPVPNGTAVEFKTTLGTFADANAQTTLRTTTNGVATVTLSSPNAGTATVTATVGTSQAAATVTFSLAPTQPQPPDLTPVITSVTPTTGRPQGGELLVINGKNFRPPFRVLFQFSDGTQKEGFVNSSSGTQINVTTPGVDLGVGQTKDATIVLFTEAGTPNEVRLTSSTTFRYEAAVLTPKVTTLSPSSGPSDGGTRVTIFGEAFQTGAKVQMGVGGAWQDVQVLNITFDQITFITPKASDITAQGSGALFGPVDLKVINVNSATFVEVAGAFSYKAKAIITTWGPTVGGAVGGTKVTIDGQGFNDPLAVSIGGVAAMPISVSPTRIVAVTSRIPSPCAGATGPVLVTMTDDGDTAASTNSFTYTPDPPIITSISPLAVTAGGATTVRVNRPGLGVGPSAIIRFQLDGVNSFVTPSEITDGAGPTNFSVTTQTDLEFPTEACTTVGGSPGQRFLPIRQDVTFLNVTTGCEETLADALTVNPTDTSCVATSTPPEIAYTPATFCPNTFGTVLVGASNTQLLTISNTNNVSTTADLSVTATITGPHAAQFTITPTSGNIARGTTQGFQVRFTPTGADGIRSATLNLLTNDPDEGLISICLEGTADAP